MKNSEIAVWIGAIAAVALVILYLVNDSGGESGGSVNPTFQVTGITADVAAIYSAERVAKIEAKKDTILGYLAQTLGLTQSANDLTLGLDQSKTALNLGTIVSNNEVKIGEAQSAAQVAAVREASAAEIQRARIEADAAKYVAKKNASGKTIGAVGGAVGGILGSVLSFF